MEFDIHLDIAVRDIARSLPKEDGDKIFAVLDWVVQLKSENKALRKHVGLQESEKAESKLNLIAQLNSEIEDLKQNLRNAAGMREDLRREKRVLEAKLRNFVFPAKTKKTAERRVKLLSAAMQNEKFISRCGNDRDMKIIDLYIKGHGPNEIAIQVDLTKHRVTQILDRSVRYAELYSAEIENLPEVAPQSV